MGQFPVWFEREVIPELAGSIDVVIDRLGPGTPDDPLFGSASAVGVVASTLVYDERALDHMPQVEVIARTGIGVDGVDIDVATRRGIAVCNTPDAPTVSTAEHTIALMLAVCKNLSDSANRLRSGESDVYSSHEAIELDGKTLGLVGFGRVARRVAGTAAALEMRVAAFDPYAPSDEVTVQQAESLNALLARSDIVSIHVPLTKENQRMFDARVFGEMRPGSILINTARGGLVDQPALLEALDRGILRAAGLDVTDPEPLPRAHPLLNRSDVLVTPHVASATHEAKSRIFSTAIRQVIQVLRGQRPDHLVNPEVWDRRQSTRQTAP